MTCPHCNYQDGWDGETLKDIRGKEGKFYMFPIRMEQNEMWETRQEEVFGCPKCGKLFMAV